MVDGGPKQAAVVKSRAYRLRKRAAEHEGFSLIELLVVILIIGILAAIAIPSFIGEKSKATGAQAKELVRTAETTAETIGTEADGHYNAVNLEELKHVEPAIPEAVSKTQAYLSAATGGTSEYTVTATTSEGTEYSITRNPNGSISRQCQSASGKKGCDGGETSSW